MIFSFSDKDCLDKDCLDKNNLEHISYVIRQCVACNYAISLRGVFRCGPLNKYEFESLELPHFTLLSLFSIYFDGMCIDCNKERVCITLIIDSSKGIPF